MTTTGTLGAEPFTLAPAEELLAPCPKFRLLVLGNIESTKIEIFSSVLGIELDKSDVAAVFRSTHEINKEIDLGNANPRLSLHTSANFGSGDKEAYKAAVDFLEARQQSSNVADRVHCIWYCVSCDDDRTIHGLEAEFFRQLPSVAPATPAILVFTKYEELIASVRQEWYRDEQKRGVSKVAASHILRDLTAHEFQKRIGRRWDAILGDEHVPKLCVATDDDSSGHAGMERLAAGTLAELKGKNERLVFAAAQRSSPAISTKVCANLAADYFDVNTGHARKRSGVEVGEILHDFFAKSIQIFNFKDPHKVLSDPRLLSRILESVFDAAELGFLTGRGSFDSSGQALIDSLTPHDRACMLTQALAGVTLFFHKLAESQWLHRDPVPQLTAHIVERELSGIRSGKERKAVFETIENSSIFTQCHLISQVSDLILKAVGQGEKLGVPDNAFVIEDDSELQEISLSFVNDHPGPDDVVLPNGMRILALN
ncbi:hypothetical protein CONLIGDRAFT_587335 [Coniochaeta ligniaria NRRL 30616]|uniref:G domain-containing protein n=1 Tax=Coniochaeta ligniaria NRRL 30616 TaxID=1408157 RepID=A0A1J7I560_9PEZI|nr:hypothetical protein CONLIGDRAFT_587335 [Coniochaeta ligniaria NRRL 30616]